MKFPLQYAKLLSQKYLNIDDDIIPEIEMCLEREGDKVSIPYEAEDFGIAIFSGTYDYSFINNDSDGSGYKGYRNGDGYGGGHDNSGNGYGDGFGNSRSNGDGEIFFDLGNRL